MTPKQKRFVQEYLVDLNATQAAIRAGYSPKRVDAIGYENLRKPEVQAAIQEQQEKISKKLELSAEWVLSMLKEVAERCMQHIPVMKFDREDKCMKHVTTEDGEGVWEFDANGANRALELIGRYKGMFIDKHEIVGDLGVIVMPTKLPVGAPCVDEELETGEG